MTSTTTVQPYPGRTLPGPSDTDAWTAALVAEIAAGVERALSTPMTRSELVECYGTCDPVVLRERFALPEDIAAAESLAAEGVSPGVAA